MDNENKWEYDYSSQDKNESGDTGYPNVGSSGTALLVAVGL